MKLKIFKIGGSLLDEKAQLNSFLLHFACTLGPKLLVHGGGKVASAIGKRMGIDEKYFEGRRITDYSTLELVTMVYGGLINKNLVAQLESLHCPSVGLCGADGSSLVAHKRPIGKIDYGWVGDLEPENFNLNLIRLCLKNGISPIFSSLSYDPEGGLLNTNADTIASALGIGLQNDYETEIYFCIDKMGVLGQNGQVIPVLNSQEMDRLQALGVIREGMLPKIKNALDALKAGVNSVTILGSGFFNNMNGAEPHLGTKVIL